MEVSGQPLTESCHALGDVHMYEYMVRPSCTRVQFLYMYLFSCDFNDFTRFCESYPSMKYCFIFFLSQLPNFFLCGNHFDYMYM